MINMYEPPSNVLLTGATGYVGGRLLPLLEGLGVHVRCLVRKPENLQGRVRPQTEVIAGDVLTGAALPAAFEGIDTAYYLIHSMASSGSFEDQDRVAAQNFAAAAKVAGVRRIIFLGGLGDDDEELSTHLRSRHEVGRILREAGCQVIEFRASIVIGSGSLSFELVRALVQRLPIMICPKWVSVLAQPIAIEDLLEYLLAALEWPGTESRIFEIGGPEPVSYGDIMREYARQRGLRRWLISVPVLTPRLSSLWLGLVTPVYARVGRQLIDSLRNPTVVKDHAALNEFPVRPRGLPEAIERIYQRGSKPRAHALVRRTFFLTGCAELGGCQVRQSDCRFAIRGGRGASAPGLHAHSSHWGRTGLVLRGFFVDDSRLDRPPLRRDRQAPRAS